MKRQIIQEILTRDFVLCFFAQFAFTSVSFILIPTLPIYLSRSGSTKVEIGVLIGAFGISSLILRPMIGRALLKIAEKKFMLAGGILFALASMSYLFAPPFWPFFIVRILQGIGSAFFFTAAIVLIPNITPEAYRGQSIGYFFLSFNISMALAPPFGMFLINQFGFTILFLICIVLSLISLIISSKLSEREVELSDHSSMGGTSFISFKGFPPTFVYFFNHIIWGALTAFFPLYAIKYHVTNPGLFFAAYAIVMISCRAFGGRILDLYNRERIILPCLSVFILSMTLLAFAKTFSMFILVAVISAIGHAFLVPSLVAYTLDLVGPDRGPGMGLLTAMGDLGMVLGPVIMGIVLQLTDFTTMFLCLALSGLINFIYFYLFAKKRKRGLFKSP